MGSCAGDVLRCTIQSSWCEGHTEEPHIAVEHGGTQKRFKGGKGPSSRTRRRQSAGEACLGGNAAQQLIPQPSSSGRLSVGEVSRLHPGRTPDVPPARRPAPRPTSIYERDRERLRETA